MCSVVLFVLGIGASARGNCSDANPVACTAQRNALRVWDGYIYDTCHALHRVISNGFVYFFGHAVVWSTFQAG